MWSTYLIGLKTANSRSRCHWKYSTDFFSFHCYHLSLRICLQNSIITVLYDKQEVNTRGSYVNYLLFACLLTLLSIYLHSFHAHLPIHFILLYSSLQGQEEPTTQWPPPWEPGWHAHGRHRGSRLLTAPPWVEYKLKALICRAGRLNE